MRAVVQRVTSSEVTVEGVVTGKIDNGFMVLLGVSEEDNEKDAEYIANKICGLRVFEDQEGKMNLSLKDAGGKVLAVSQFTLYGDCRKGNRPSFIQAARPEKAKLLYDHCIELIKGQGIETEEGIFQAEMLVKINNDGPVTILMDSKRTF